MPTPHLSIKIIQRSSGQSAVAAAAYQSGQKLYSEYDQAVKYYPKKRGILHSEILLPSHAPPEYADRNALWNAVEKIEKQWNSQLARRFEIALPREIPEEQYADLVRDYCREFFVSKGMCVDFAIHDPYPPGHNPHAHIMLTMRAMDENGRWIPKSRKVYDLDKNGERIKLPSGYWKSHKENTVDWSEQSNAEIWRQGWADWQNRYLERNGCTERVDLRSYERQGIDRIPTVHMGPAVTAMERRGIRTDIGNLNREISRLNRILQSIKKLIRELKGNILELRQKEEVLKSSQKSQDSVFLSTLLMEYMNIRKNERADWSPYGRQKAGANDLKKVSQAMNYLEQLGLQTVDDLDEHIAQSEKESSALSSDIRSKKKRIKEIDRILAAHDDFIKYHPFFEKYATIRWKKTKEKYKQDNPEVVKFFRAKYYLDKHLEGQEYDQNSLQAEQAVLSAEILETAQPMEAMQTDLKQLRDIRYWVQKATPGTEENREPPEKQSVVERLHEPTKFGKNRHCKDQNKER